MEVSVLPSQVKIDDAEQEVANEPNKKKKKADLRSWNSKGVFQMLTFQSSLDLDWIPFLSHRTWRMP